MDPKQKAEGICKGEICNREDCDGVILEHDINGGCSCHINPPCGYCTSPKAYCPKCDWDEKDEWIDADKLEADYWEEYHKRPDVIAAKEKVKQEDELFDNMYRGKIPVDKYRARHKSHSSCSQIIYGVHPNMSRQEIEKDAKGTFGGRFSRYNEYSFEYIAYTD